MVKRDLIVLFTIKIILLMIVLLYKLGTFHLSSAGEGEFTKENVALVTQISSLGGWSRGWRMSILHFYNSASNYLTQKKSHYLMSTDACAILRKFRLCEFSFDGEALE